MTSARKFLLALLLLVGFLASLSASTSLADNAAVSSGPSVVETSLSASERRITTTNSPSTTTTTQAPTTTTPPPTTATTAPAPPPTTAAAVQPDGACGGWRDLITLYFPPSQVGKACTVMLCESQGNPNAVSPTNDHGLFQINRRYNEANFVQVTGQPWSAVYDPAANTQYAAWLYSQRGWGAWTCGR